MGMAVSLGAGRAVFGKGCLCSSMARLALCPGWVLRKFNTGFRMSMESFCSSSLSHSLAEQLP